MIKNIESEIANNMIGDKIRNNELFNYMRFGMGYETFIPYHIYNNLELDKNMLEKAHLHSGLYGNKDDILYYHKLFIESVQNRTMFLKWNVGWLNKYENYFIDNFQPKSGKCDYVDAGSNESFRYSKPFSKEFENKKVLVVSNFTDSITSQFQKKDLLFKNKDILPNFELVTYKSVSSFCMQNPHSGWKESYEIMRDDISKLDFDIALIGCASYSQPLVNFIYNDMNKVAMNLGGGLPLYFGILGKRWENDNFIKNVNLEHWIKPSLNEQPPNYKLIEGGCYW